MTDIEKSWTYEIARPHGRVWLQSTERFSSAEGASIGLGLYLALSSEPAGSFIGRVILAKEVPPHPRGYIVHGDKNFH